jgi:hypothetical protein
MMAMSATPGGRLMKKIHCQPQLSVSQPPMEGPMEGPKIAVMPKMARPMVCFEGGSSTRMMLKASGISAPPNRPCSARQAMSSCRFPQNAQSSEKMRKPVALSSR